MLTMNRILCPKRDGCKYRNLIFDSWSCRSLHINFSVNGTETLHHPHVSKIFDSKFSLKNVFFKFHSQFTWNTLGRWKQQQCPKASKYIVGFPESRIVLDRNLREINAKLSSCE